MKTRGAVEVGLLALRFGAAGVARAVDVDEGSVRQWVAGKTKPRKAKRLELRKVYDLDLAAWDEEAKNARSIRGAPEAKNAEEATPARARKGRRAVDTVAAKPDRGAPASDTRAADAEPRGEVGDGATEAQETLSRLKKRLVRLEADKKATPKEVAAVEAQILNAQKQYAKVTGATDLTVSQILRSAAWRSVKAVVLEALTAFPDALEAVAIALRRHEGAS